MEILTWALLILLLLTMSIKIVKLGKRVKRIERFVRKAQDKELHTKLEAIFGDMDKVFGELLASKPEKNERKRKKTNG